MSVRQLFLSFGLLTAVAALAPDRALACSGILCGPASVTPWGGPVPPDLAGFTVKIGQNRTQSSVSVREAAFPNPVLAEAEPLAGTSSFALSQPLVTGRGYTVRLSSLCGGGSGPAGLETAQWVAEAPSVAPTSFPALAVLHSGIRSLMVPVQTGECYATKGVPAILFELDLSALSPGYRNALQDVQLVLDGQPVIEPIEPVDEYYFRTGGAPDLLAPTRKLELFAACDPEDPHKKHSVLARATVPTKTPYQVESPAIELELPCAEVASDAGVTVSADAGGSVFADAGSAGASDAGSDKTDARAVVDAEQTAVLDQDDASRSGCAVGGGRRSQGTALAMLTGLLALAARRTRARRKQ